MITTLFALSILAAAPVAQDPVAPAASVAVNYSDLNLNTAKGRAELDRRLNRAVAKVCPAPDHRQLSQLQATEACRQVALTSANQQRQIALASVASPVLIGSSGR